MLHGRRGRRTSLFALSLAAMLVWTGAIADPAFAVHNRSRPFSIVDPERPVPDAPDLFTCEFIEDENDLPVDYRCTNSDGSFNRLLTGSEEDNTEPLIDGDTQADAEQTEVRSPSEFTCTHNGGNRRLPEDFDCDPNRGRDFTLAEFAYVQYEDDEQDEGDPPPEYALPCRPCVADPQP